MNQKDRLKIGKQQLKNYLASQYPKWRHVQVLIIHIILKNMPNFYSNIIEDIKQPYDATGEITLNKEIKNGLIFSALAETMQYIEDLFSLMLLSKNIEYFVKNVIRYNATKVYQYIKKFNVNDLKNICSEYQIPYFDINKDWQNAQELFLMYKKAILNLQENLAKFVDFYLKYEKFYSQYKHGLSVALNPYGSKTPSSIEANEGYLMIYDNTEISKITAKSKKLICIPHLTPAVAKSILQLNQEENLLRAEFNILSIDDLIIISKNIGEMLEILHLNLFEICNNTEKTDFNEYYLPYKQDNKYIKMGFPVDN